MVGSCMEGRSIRFSLDGLSGKHTLASRRPPRPSNVDILGKPASNTSKSRVCPPIAKGVSRRVPVTDASKRNTRLQRSFTSTLTARSEVHLKFELMHETLFLMINLIDRFLSVVYTIPRKDLQLVGLTAMLVAAKYEEIWAPKVKELITISNNVYTCGEVLSMEKLMLNKLRFNLAVPTPFVFMKRFLKAAQADKKLEELAFYLVELCLGEYEALKWKPSMLAASAIYTAQHILQRMPAWTRLLQKHAHYRESELKECADMIAGFHKNAEEGDLKAVYNKYSSSQFGGVAKLLFAASPLLGN